MHIQAGSHIKGQELLREKKAPDVGIISTFHATRSIQIVALLLPLLVLTTDCAGLVPPLVRHLGITAAPVGGSISNILFLCRKSFQSKKPSLKCTFALLEWSNLLKFARTRLVDGETVQRLWLSIAATRVDPSDETDWEAIRGELFTSEETLSLDINAGSLGGREGLTFSLMSILFIDNVLLFGSSFLSKCKHCPHAQRRVFGTLRVRWLKELLHADQRHCHRRAVLLLLLQKKLCRY